MFWNEQFPETIAAIDIVLQMPDVSVQDIVFEDDILQECKTSNPKLIEFLTKKGSIVDLVDNITSLTESQCTDRSIRSCVHSAYVSCEILTSGVSEITHALFCDKKSIEKILSCLVDTTNDSTITPADNACNTDNVIKAIPLKTTFIGKLIKFMHSQKSEEFFCHIIRDETKTFKRLIDFLLNTIDLSGSLEILEALMEDTEPRETRFSYCALLAKENIINRLIDILSQSEFEDKQRNAGQILCDIIRIGRQVSSADATENNSSEFFHDPLLKILESTETVSSLLDKMFLDVNDLEKDLQKASPTTLVCGMNVLQSILEYKRHNILHGRNLDSDRFHSSHQSNTNCLDINQQGSEKWPSVIFEINSNHEGSNDLFDNNDKDSGYSDSVDASMLAKAISQAQAAIEGKLHYFHQLLIDPPRQEPIKTTFGLIAKPLGYTRLEVIHLLRALISTNSPNIIKKIVDLKTIKFIVDLFINYPWNNLLHTQVEQSLCLIVNNYRRDADKHFVATATTTVAAAAAAAVTLAASQSAAFGNLKGIQIDNVRDRTDEKKQQVKKEIEENKEVDILSNTIVDGNKSFEDQGSSIKEKCSVPAGYKSSGTDSMPNVPEGQSTNRTEINEDDTKKQTIEEDTTPSTSDSPSESELDSPSENINQMQEEQPIELVIDEESSGETKSDSNGVASIEGDQPEAPSESNCAPDSQQSQQEMASQLLLTQLLDECDLIQRIIPSEIDLKRERSPEQANFGHIVQIASYISINGDLDPIKDHLSDMKANRPELYERWKTFIDVHVASFNATSTKFTAPRPFTRHDQALNHVNQRQPSQQYQNNQNHNQSAQDDEEELVTTFFAFQTQEVAPNIDAVPRRLKPRRAFSYFPEL